MSAVFDLASVGQAVEAAGGAAPPAPAREADWAEGEEGAAAARAAGELGLLTATEPLARLFLGWRSPSLQQARALAGSGSRYGFRLVSPASSSW